MQVYSNEEYDETHNLVLEIGRNIESYVNACAKCNELRPRVDKSNGTQLKVAPWEQLHMDWAQIQQVDNVSIKIDAGSGWIEAFVCGD